MTSTGSALELQSNKLGQLSHKLNGLHHDLASVKDTVYGSAATAAAALEQDGGGSGGLLGGTSVSQGFSYEGGRSMLANVSSRDQPAYLDNGMSPPMVPSRLCSYDSSCQNSPTWTGPLRTSRGR